MRWRLRSVLPRCGAFSATEAVLPRGAAGTVCICGTIYVSTRRFPYRGPGLNLLRFREWLMRNRCTGYSALTLPRFLPKRCTSRPCRRQRRDSGLSTTRCSPSSGIIITTVPSAERKPVPT